MSNRTKPLFGPAGNSESFYAAGFKRTVEAPAWLAGIGLDAYEYQCGNGVRGNEESFRAIGKEAEIYGISMSLHAPYYISLSGVELEKRLKSIEYIQKSIDAAAWLGADIIVVHTGSAAKISREQAMDYARDTLYKTLCEIKNPAGVRIGLETMGKLNQLGTIDEVIDLCKIGDILCPVIDFGHVNARNVGGFFRTAEDYKAVFDKIGDKLGDNYAQNLHCHFSKIEFTDKGEKKHLTFADTIYGPPYEPLAEAISEYSLSPRIICESDGTQADDALTLKKRTFGQSLSR